MVDRWLENLIDTNESQMTTLNATFDPFVGTLTTKNMASCTSCRGGLLQALGLREERWHNQSLAVDDGLIFPLKLQTSLSYLRSQGVTVKLLTRGSIYIEQLS